MEKHGEHGTVLSHNFRQHGKHGDYGAAFSRDFRQHGKAW